MRASGVLIVGAGVIGILTAQVARACGAGEIVLIDRLASRRAVIDRLGLGKLLLADEAALDEQLLAAGGPVDLVYDTVCSEATLALGARRSRPAGAWCWSPCRTARNRSACRSRRFTARSWR